MIPFLTQMTLRSTPLLIARPIRKYSYCAQKKLNENHPIYTKLSSIMKINSYIGGSMGGIFACINILKFHDENDLQKSIVHLMIMVPVNLQCIPIGMFLGPFIIPCAAAGITGHYLIEKVKENKRDTL